MRFIKKESGSAMVEVALFLPMYILILVGIADYGYLIVEKIHVQEAAAAGAAYGTIPGKYKDTTGMTAAAKASSSMLGSSLTVSAVNTYSCTTGGSKVTSIATCPSGCGPLMYAQVTTSYSAKTVLDWIGIPSIVTLQGFASYEVPWTP